ncbi:hypothetical protein [Acidisoma sp. S159]|uniref:hypothetical protein n=1 Tax=Acidisoma sp. S159 TaxID=1747225 RepID=UPI00131BD5BF|nr:hypothetical protein [Acidisoma sp. S159]
MKKLFPSKGAATPALDQAATLNITLEQGLVKEQNRNERVGRHLRAPGIKPVIYAVVSLVVLCFWLRASLWGIPMMFLLEALFLGPIFVTWDLASQSSGAEYFALLAAIAVAPVLIKTLTIYALRTRTPARAQ